MKSVILCMYVNFNQRYHLIQLHIVLHTCRPICVLCIYV